MSSRSRSERPRTSPAGGSYEIRPGSGAISIPGFVDLQVNGHRGVDFSSPELTEESFVFACRELSREGTRLFLPTIITSPPALIERNLKLMTRALAYPEVAEMVAGFHIEGPFISPLDGARGAHDRSFVREPDLELLRSMRDWSGDRILILTVSAGLPGVEPLIRAGGEAGIRISLGHQLPSEEELHAAVDAGATALTHLGNGIPAMLPRTGNPLFHALVEDRLIAMIITDGHHLPSAFITTVLRMKGPERTIVVSDQSPIAGFPPGEYRTLGNRVILSPEGRLYNPDNGYLVGSSSVMRRCMNHLASLGVLSGEDLLRVGFLNPLRFIGREPGSVTVGESGPIELVGGSFAFRDPDEGAPEPDEP